MNPPQRPDPSFHHSTLHHLHWLVMPWQKANPRHQYHATNPAPPDVPATPEYKRELNGCEMALVIVGGILMFVGFLVPISILAGLFCFLVAIGLSNHWKR